MPGPISGPSLSLFTIAMQLHSPMNLLSDSVHCYLLIAYNHNSRPVQNNLEIVLLNHVESVYFCLDMSLICRNKSLN